MGSFAVLPVVLAGCGRIAFDPRSDSSTIDAEAPRCDPMAPFTSILPVQSLNTPALEGGLRFTDDELVAYWHGNPAGTFGIWTARRDSRKLAFGPPTQVIAGSVFWPDVTPDQLTLVYNDFVDILIATRGSTAEPFGTPVVLAAASSPTLPERTAYFGPRGDTLYFSRYDTEGEIFVGSWPALDDIQGVGGLETASEETAPTFSSDERVIYFTRALASADIMVAVRDDATSAFQPPVLVPELSSPAVDTPTWLSQDHCRLYFNSDRGGDFGLYVAERALP